MGCLHSKYTAAVCVQQCGKLMEEPLYLAFHKDSWLRNMEKVRLSDIRNEQFVMLRSGGSIRTISEAIFEKEGIIPDIAFECDNVHV